MEIKLIKNWQRRNKIIRKGEVLEVTMDLGRDLIKKKIAKRHKDGLIALAAALMNKDKEPLIESKQGYRKSNNKKKEK